MTEQKRVIINTYREGYSFDQVDAVTVEDLIGMLTDFEPDALIYLSFDNGYTFGSFEMSSIDYEEVEESDEYEES